MTNVSTPKKAGRRQLFAAGVDTLEKQGWTVERAPHHRSSSVRRITKGGKSLLAAITTTQDQHLAYPRDKADKAWVTLSDVDVVVAVSVNDVKAPRFALVHFFDADEVRERYDRTYKARLSAGHSIPLGRGVWLSLYREEDHSVPSRVGAGIGLKYPPIAPPVPLSAAGGKAERAAEAPAGPRGAIAEAKALIAAAYGVDPASVRITIEA
jgi:hypothetical protein